MSIEDYQEKIKGVLKSPQFEAFYTPTLVILVGFAAFGLGRLSISEENRVPITIEYPADYNIVEQGMGKTENDVVVPKVSLSANVSSSGSVVASKNGTKYYLPWCAGASRISPSNLVNFVSKEEAEKAGYGPAANCKGL